MHLSHSHHRYQTAVVRSCDVFPKVSSWVNIKSYKKWFSGDIKTQITEGTQAPVHWIKYEAHLEDEDVRLLRQARDIKTEQITYESDLSDWLQMKRCRSSEADRWWDAQIIVSCSADVMCLRPVCEHVTQARNHFVLLSFQLGNRLIWCLHWADTNY